MMFNRPKYYTCNIVNGAKQVVSSIVYRADKGETPVTVHKALIAHAEQSQGRDADIIDFRRVE